MDDLLKQITEKTGISVDKAKEVVETVMGFIGDKLPAPIADQVTKLIGGASGAAGGAAGGLGGMLDKGKDALGGLMGGGDK